MYERSLNEAELILSGQKDAILPVRRIWEEVVRLSKKKGFEVASLADFSAMLDGDIRFQIIPAQKEKPDDDFLSDEIEFDDPEMEKLGFYSEDQVKLRASKNFEQPISEDEEEVGSIKRKAFVTPKTKKIKLPVKATIKKKTDSKKKSKSIKKKKNSSLKKR